jgi:hypothetical protein
MRKTAAFLLAHGTAIAICLVIFSAAPILLYGLTVMLGVIFNGDPGGLLNFVLVPAFSVGLALVTVFAILLPLTVLTQWVCRRFAIPFWVPLAGIFPASTLIFLGLAFLRNPSIEPGLLAALVALWCLIGSVCFALYWIPLQLVDGIARRFLRIA